MEMAAWLAGVVPQEPPVPLAKSLMVQVAGSMMRAVRAMAAAVPRMTAPGSTVGVAPASMAARTMTAAEAASATEAATAPKAFKAVAAKTVTAKAMAAAATESG